MTLHYRVGVHARLAAVVIDEIERRFGPVRVTQGRQVTVHGCLADQAALRGLLTLLWDANAEVTSLRVGGAATAERPRDRHRSG